MRVLLLNQYYHPDVAATAQLAADLGEALARRGHAVTAIASNRAYSGDGRWPLVGEQAGVKIRRVPATAIGRANRLGRALDYGTFLAAALGPVLAARPEVIVALSTPPLVAALGLVARKLLGARLIYWVMDVYPEVAVKLGALAAGGAPERALTRVSRALLDGADAVVALDDAMRDRLIESGAAPHKIEVIDNWCDGEAIRPVAREGHPLRRALGLGDDFCVSYSGNMGRGHDFATIVEAMERAREEPIRWLFVGDGPRRGWLMDEVKRRRLARAIFRPYVPRADLAASLTVADASLVTLERDLAGLLVPSKLYALLAAGVPVLYVGPREGRVAETVRDEKVGIAVDNGDAAALVAALRTLRDDRPAREAMGRRGRALFDARFRRELAVEQHHQLLLRVAGAPC